jgi:aminoglycoside phosphotransferase (APT) family kinase protein
LKAAGPRFAFLDPAGLAAALPEPDRPALVHLDAFAGNMLAKDGRITAVLDFGGVPIVGDRRLDPLAAAAYLDPDITPTASDADRAVAQEWLAERGLADLYDAARRWLAAFWSAAIDDVRLHEWCGSILRA